jgi:hypothetical protein
MNWLTLQAGAATWRNASVALLVAALSCGLAGWLSFQTGCAGDPKSRALGDPLAAIELENWVLPLWILGWLALWAAVTMIWYRLTRLKWRIEDGVVIGVVTFLALLPLAMQLETMGVDHCLG